MIEKLIKIQKELKAPKNQYNSFGKYHYRSCEDILEAVKPLLGDLVLTVSDDIIEVGGRVYVKATARITDGEKVFEVSASAREAQDKKGMDDAQITGAASSYARKYALNGLFLIDDTKDADSTNTHGKEQSNVSANWDPVPNQKVEEALQETLGKCSKCGADNKRSQAGKIYCGAKCWLK